jgi:hypothetical protein
MRRDQRDKRIVPPLHQRNHDHRHYRYEDEDLERGGDLSDHLNAAHVDPGNHRNQRHGDEVVLPSRDSGEEVIGEENGVSSP